MEPLRHALADWDDLVSTATPHLERLFRVQEDPTQLPVSSDAPSLRVRAQTPGPLPKTGRPLAELLPEVLDLVLQQGYCNGAHPQYHGYFHPRPLPVTVLGDAIASLLNQSPAAWRMGPAATALEYETLAWLADFVGYPRGGPDRLPGVFTSGGSTANLAGLKLARDVTLGREVQDAGLADSPRRLTFYASSETHYSIPRALDVLGVGRDALRVVPVDEHGRISLPALRDLIARDVAAGRTPACVVGLACATATGAVDPLTELADVAAEHDMWFHVDGAGGAPYAGLPETGAAFAGLDRADSLTVDPHKWLFTPYGLGCLLVRDSAELARSFRGGAHYWQVEEDVDTVFMAVEGARPWKSLGLWLAMSQLGSEGYADLLARNLGVARHLADRVRAREGFELFGEPTVAICCFRVLPADPAVDADALNERLQQRLADSGEFFVTTCRPDGRVFLRAAISNFGTEERHVEALLAALDAARSDVL
ncbi:pyridoxal phosphate-dependent decarboxylase family protein [Umezawaea beigongshangensis]|uniref:pyridoxal phosphate-dependent decarboxylase family protein n=1 Tax=Umezawaea beigongshangensis TaxID=2780383 RepID=UPI0018F1218E|nr:aminotransferase class V-fold PLP-dependent enzyme [Umezawaea beigongshangensis]